MLKELYTAALSMIPQQTRLEVISNNLANANTVGYKKSEVFERNLIDAKANFFNIPTNVEQDDPPVGSYIIFTNGAFHQTGNKLDLAIQNENSFFIVENDSGEQFFTRAGSFTISNDGFIVNDEGEKLIGSNGAINIKKQFLIDRFNALDKQSLDIRISQFGEIFVNDEEIDSIKLANIKNPQTLIRINHSNFSKNDNTEINFVEPDKVNIKQGWLEQSNVNIIQEMIDMIELQRLFETNSKVITTNNDTLNDSIAMSRFF